jgi:predicted aspartyl protease
MLMLLVTIAAAPADARHPVKGCPADVVSFANDRDGAIILPVWIDGKGPFRFLLDTGSNLSAVSERLVAAWSLAPVAKTALTTVGGTAMRPVVQLGDVSVGSVSRAGLLASIATSDELALLGAGVDGMLGQDFLATYNFTVDYRRQRLVWDAQPGADAAKLRLIPRDGRFVVRLPTGLGQEALEMVPDTGSSSFVVFARDNGPAWLPAWRQADVTISGLTGSRQARYSRLQELRLGDLTLRDIPVVIVHRDDAGHEGADGLLPLHLFSRVTFRVSEGYMAVER